ncbi:MAG: hypothetical protein H0X45_15635, partial [Planctomycetes bacterium]|nr:hypothetical protein [Planctomycetota bacterium]
MSTTQQQPLDGQRETTELRPVDFSLGDRDVRRKRPPALSFLLRLETLRRVARVATLLLADFVGIFMAILTALWLKAGLVSGD